MYSGFQCHRCYDEFATETALYNHQRADNPCEKKPVSNKIDVQQEKQLRSRMMYRKSLNNEEKWNAVYKIIFPDAEVVPSPCTQSLPNFQPQMLRANSYLPCSRLRAAQPGYYRNLLMNRLPTLVRMEVSNSMTLTPLLLRIEICVTTALKECLTLMDDYKKE